METSDFVKAEEVSQRVGVSRGQAYKIIRKLNDELADLGYLTFSGKTSRAYFDEKMYRTSQKYKEGSDDSANIQG